MIAVLGNCQAAMVAQALARCGAQVKYFLFPATDFSTMGIRASRQELTRLADSGVLLQADWAQSTVIVPSLEDIAQACPRMLVVSMFHERAGLYVGHDGAQLILPDESLAPAWRGRRHPPRYVVQRRSAQGYMARLRRFVRRLRERFPETPLVLLRRLSPLPYLNPAPYSWLEGWSRHWRAHQHGLEALLRETSGLRLVDFDCLMERFLEQGGSACEHAQMTILRDRTAQGDLLYLGRDIEHVGAFFADAVADAVIGGEDHAQAAEACRQRLARSTGAARWLGPPKRRRVAPAQLQHLETFVRDGFDNVLRNPEHLMYNADLSGIGMVELRHVRPRAVQDLLEGFVRILLFGAGGRGRKLLALLREKLPEVDVLGFADNNPALRGTRMQGLPVYALEEALALEPGAVVLTSFYKAEIQDRLRAAFREARPRPRVIATLDEISMALCFEDVQSLVG